MAQSFSSFRTKVINAQFQGISQSTIYNIKQMQVKTLLYKAKALYQQHPETMMTSLSSFLPSSSEMA